jgi:hypothetical protein
MPWDGSGFSRVVGKTLTRVLARDAAAAGRRESIG